MGKISKSLLSSILGLAASENYETTSCVADDNVSWLSIFKLWHGGWFLITFFRRLNWATELSKIILRRTLVIVLVIILLTEVTMLEQFLNLILFWDGMMIMMILPLVIPSLPILMVMLLEEMNL